MFDPVANLNAMFDTGMDFIGIMFEVYFGPFLMLVLGPVVRISEYFGAL